MIGGSLRPGIIRSTGSSKTIPAHPLWIYRHRCKPTRRTPSVPDDAEGATTAAPALQTKITVEEYQRRKALKEVHVATFLDKDEYREMLDYEDFAPQDDPANIHIGYQMPTPAPQEVHEPTASHESTIPKTPVHHPMAAANKAPGFGRGVPLCASPMQVGMPITSPRKMLMHGTTAVEVLLHGATLPCSLQQEAAADGQPPEDDGFSA